MGMEWVLASRSPSRQCCDRSSLAHACLSAFATCACLGSVVSFLLFVEFCRKRDQKIFKKRDETTFSLI